MPDFTFEREVRTPYSEAYTIHENERQVGRIDIHFALDMVHVAVAVDEAAVAAVRAPRVSTPTGSPLSRQSTSTG